MKFTPAAKKFFIWFVTVFVLIYLFENHERIKHFIFTPDAKGLSYNKEKKVEDDRPVIMSTDEKINIDVFQASHEAVVNVITTTLNVNFWREVTPKSGQGSGFIIDKRGYILTNSHVIGKAQEITVTLGNGSKTQATLVGRDITSDIAIIKIPSSYVTRVANLGNSDSIKIGQKAIAIGNPFGLSHTLTTGIISALDREVSGDGGTTLYDLIQTDCAINPGNSGGPLLNSNGEVIGMNTAIFSLSGGSQGIGFSIPINKAKDVATALITSGTYDKPWLGITGITLSSEFSKALGLNVSSGVLVVEVIPDSPADITGIIGGDTEVTVGNFNLMVGGDVIVSLNGVQIIDMKSLVREISRYKIGETIGVSIIRNNVPLDLHLTLQKNPNK